MERKKFKHAVIFKEDDIRENLTSCVVSCTDEYYEDEVTILSEDEYGKLKPFAEINNCYSSRELTIFMDDSDSRMAEIMFNIAEIIRSKSDFAYEQCIDMVEAITKRYNITNK